LVGMVTGVITSFGFLGSLLVISPLVVAMVVIGVVPILVAELSLARRRAALLWHITPLQRRELMHSMVLSDVQAAKEIRLFDIGGFLLGRVRADRVTANETQCKLDRRELGLQSGLGVLTAITTGVGLVWAVNSAYLGRLSVGDVTLFVASVAGVQGALFTLVRSIAVCQQQLLLFGHLTTLERTADTLSVPARPRRVPLLRQGIELRDVWFRYSSDLPWVLRGVDMFVPARSALAVVGHNGTGKSTLVKLLCRLYDPTQGVVLWDGVDVREYDPVELRRRIGVVFQDFMQYDLTAAENIAVGDLSRLGDRVRLRDAAQRAGIHDVLEQLPRGYDTMLTRILLGLGDADDTTGVPLSGGQWQRLALARALLRDDNDLLILDEPSSGMDAEAEYEIHSRLRAYRSATTSVLISHRLAAVRDADQIVVLDEGRIVERGNHPTLIAEGGRYAHLFDLQAQGYQAEPADGYLKTTM
jgi:ATP-binding cassette subfamily B protein